MCICLHVIQQTLTHLYIYKNICFKIPVKIIKKCLFKLVSFDEVNNINKNDFN